MARGTVDRYVDGAEPGKRKPAERPSPKRAKTQAQLEKLIGETAVAKKQQLTAQRAHELLRGGGVNVGYSLVKEVMAERRRASKEVFVPLEYAPGELAEVDFFEVDVVVDGEPVTAFMFLMRLMASSRDFCWLYPRQDQVCFLDGHVRAFEHFGVVPSRAAYDNLKAAVKRHLVGSERELSARFLAMTVHYALEASFCRPRTGHDKGGVESRGKAIRLQSMVPVPSGGTLDEVAAGVLADVDRRFWLRADAQARWAAESSAMHALPRRPFDARKQNIAVPVSSTATVVIEGATYSVPSSWARSTATSYAGVLEVEVVHKSSSIKRQRIPKGQRDIDYAAHYLDVLSTKPQAVRQVADKLMAQLGGAFPGFWATLVEDNGPRDGARKMARILKGIIDLGRDECERRVAAALLSGDALSTALLVPVAAGEASCAAGLPAAFNIDVEASSVHVFDALLSLGGVH